MSINRICPFAPNDHERVIYALLARVYESARAIGEVTARIRAM